MKSGILTSASAIFLIGSVGLTSGCTTQQQSLAAQQPDAEKVALTRGRFELSCPTATATVLSSDFIQPAIRGAFVGGMERAEYTIGVEGCSKKDVYIVICQVGNDCFAAQSNDQN